jgi:hypothetical protein
MWTFQKQTEFEKNIDSFKKIIMKHLDNRDKKNDMSIFQPSEEDSFFPKYVMDMCKDINNQMPNVELDRIKSKETMASGHIDYVNKFALYCAELYMGLVK